MTPREIALLTIAKLEHGGQVPRNDASTCLPVEEASAAQVDMGLFHM